MTKTMVKGVLKTWKEDRGFGFIGPEHGGKDIFIHITALKGASRRPVSGDIIYYQVARDNRGKFKAINAHIDGVEIQQAQNIPAPGLPNSRKNMLLIVSSLLSVAAVVAAVIYYAA